MFNKIYQKLTEFTKTPEIIHFWSNFDCFPFSLDIWHTFFVTNRPLYTRLPFHQSSPPDRLFTLIIPRAAEDSRSHLFFHLRRSEHFIWGACIEIARRYTHIFIFYIFGTCRIKDSKEIVHVYERNYTNHTKPLKNSKRSQLQKFTRCTHAF